MGTRAAVLIPTGDAGWYRAKHVQMDGYPTHTLGRLEVIPVAQLLACSDWLDSLSPPALEKGIENWDDVNLIQLDGSRPSGWTSPLWDASWIFILGDRGWLALPNI